jgi:hypothetical protein
MNDKLLRVPIDVKGTKKALYCYAIDAGMSVDKFLYLIGIKYNTLRNAYKDKNMTVFTLKRFKQAGVDIKYFMSDKIILDDNQKLSENE